MAQYTAIFTKPYEDGYENLPSQNTPITAETLNDKDDAIVNIETYLSGNDIPSDAEGLSYDNTDSGLTADDVQGAIDELADEKVDKTWVDVKTDTTGQFNTITGGLLESCVVDIEPIQSGSGTPSPQNVRPITGHSSVEVDVTDADSNTTQYTIALRQTVYGGKLDVASGVLTVDKGYLTENDFTTVNSGTSSGGLYWTDYMLSAVDTQMVLCNMIEPKLSTQGWASTTPCVQEGAISPTQYSVRIYCTESNITDFRTTYSGLQIVYKLPTPLTIQLTPQQINTLIGENHLDVPLEGQSLESLTYREVMAWDDVTDVVKAVDDKNADVSAIGTDESGRTTASKAYAIGEHFYKDGKFCTAKTAIASGATFTLNTNYVEGTIATLLDGLIAIKDLTNSGYSVSAASGGGRIASNIEITGYKPISVTVISITGDFNGQKLALSPYIVDDSYIYANYISTGGTTGTAIITIRVVYVKDSTYMIK